MKKWPENNKTVPFEDLVKSVKSCVNFHYKLKRIHTFEPMDYKGYDIGSSIRATSLSPNESLTLDNLERDREQGRDPMDTIIAIAIQLGIEQGIRVESEKTDLLRLTIDLLSKQLEENERDCQPQSS